MAEALDSPRRKALFEQMNREEAEHAAREAIGLTREECFKRAMDLTRFAFDLAEAASAARPVDLEDLELRWGPLPDLG